MVPNGWSRLKLPEFAWFQEGPGLRNWQFTESGCKVINITNIVDGTLDLSKTDRHISEEELKDKYSHFLCDAGDIVLASSGNSYCKHGIVREQDLPLVMNTSVIRFKALENCDYEFLNQFLKSSYLKKQIDILITGGAQPNFGPVHLKQIELNLPPLPEQQKIATILSTWDKAIGTTERLIDNSSQQKKALMQQLLTGKRRLLDDSGKRFEGDWEEVKLSEVAQITMGSSPKSDAYNDVGNGLPLLQGNADIKNRKSTPRIYTSQITKECHVDDILFSVRAPVGTVALSNHHACIGRGIAAIKSKKDHSQDYLYQWLLSFETKWERYSQGSTFEAVNSNDIRSLNLSVPTLQEQQKIATVLTNADKEIELLEQQLADLQQEKKALMQVLLTGKKRVVVDG